MVRQTEIMLTEKERRIVTLKREGKTVREIARLTGSSFSKIKKVSTKAEEEERLVADKKVKLEEQSEAADRYTQALDLFSRGKSSIEVATSTGLKADEVLSIERDYWRLVRADELALLYEQNKRHLSSIIELSKRMREEGISEDEIISALREIRFLRHRIYRKGQRLIRLNNATIKAQEELQSLDYRRHRLESKLESHKEFQVYKEYQRYSRIIQDKTLSEPHDDYITPGYNHANSLQ